MITAWLSLGSNLDDPVRQLELALQRLRRAPAIEDLEASSFYRTPPWGDTAQDEFVNAVVRVRTLLSAHELLRLAQSIESEMGRVRSVRRWGPRLIDIDVLLYGGEQYANEDLTIPHPRLHERAFVLLPMTELDPELEIPGRGRLRDLLGRLDSTGIQRMAGVD
ncbi:MAG: 2-amino-4-hydroxy-6-hydroxymethyldihydropteridine diphosphokinase [Lysobacterales bacterium]|jgi:2-amino-4-hydroxy-6-hydroxymethyldihydropteridine diphosphokinase